MHSTLSQSYSKNTRTLIHLEIKLNISHSVQVFSFFWVSHLMFGTHIRALAKFELRFTGAIRRWCFQRNFLHIQDSNPDLLWLGIEYFQQYTTIYVSVVFNLLIVKKIKNNIYIYINLWIHFYIWKISYHDF